MKSSFYGTIVFLLAFTCVSFAAPKPALVQSPSQWTLNTTFTHPQQIVLESSVDKKPVRFWYIILTITNNSGADVGFYPKCELVTDTFQIIPAGKGVGTLVFDKIKDRHKKAYPFLELLGGTDNKIIQGQDNTKDIAIIWPDFDSNAKSINIYITGLSNETIEIESPANLAKKQNAEQKKIYLKKTLDLYYRIKGNPSSLGGAALEYKEKSWVMR